LTLWRISNHNDLSGTGGERVNGRWHTAHRGKRIVYLSEHPALALVEVLANLSGNPKLFPHRYQLLKIRVAEGVTPSKLRLDGLSMEWRKNFQETQSAGDAWLAGRTSALLAVPSGPSPESLNYLLNPVHAEAKSVTVQWFKSMEYDQRLFHLI
jgi:RES domain-containing protein